MAPVWRVITGALRAFACGAAVWMVVAWWLGLAGQSHVLTQLRSFAWLVLLPEALAWLLLRLHAVRCRREGARSLITLHGCDHPLTAAEGSLLQAWALQLPDVGATAMLADVGKRAFAAVDPATLADACPDCE